ncbi:MULTISPECIES: DUF5822 domain-containing protein [Halorubrum]|uniref:Peptidoglycan-binding protein n=1 Tax=Halorubrum ruber TaxID=2982524 RepID=A0A8T8LNB4_9EURY|nr:MULTISPECIES: DUF5822 domain-containing protein [Halorubrum]QUO48300.1 hypothetical protein J7656_02795 [Halorubrum ruber]
MQPVERAEYEGVDYAWVMQTTFVVTILVGAPAAALLSTLVTLESWGARAAFAVRVGAPIWFVTAVAVALYARRAEAGDGGAGTNDDAVPDEEAGSADDAATDDDGRRTEDGDPTTNEAGKRD